jgi:hypothetical protein
MPCHIGNMVRASDHRRQVDRNRRIGGALGNMTSQLSIGANQPVNLRRLRMFVVVLAISNVGLGLFSVLALKKLDQEYSYLIGSSVPLLNELRATDRDASKLYLAIIAGLVTRDPVKCDNALKQAAYYLEHGSLDRTQVTLANLLKQNPALATELRGAGEAYERSVRALLPRVTPENTADAERDRVEDLQRVYNRYAAAMRDVSVFVTNSAEASSSNYSSETWRRSLLVLGFAGWPVILAIAIVALTVTIMAVTLLLFRSSDSGDGP